MQEVALTAVLCRAYRAVAKLFTSLRQGFAGLKEPTEWLKDGSSSCTFGGVYIPCIYSHSTCVSMGSSGLCCVLFDVF